MATDCLYTPMCLTTTLISLVKPLSEWVELVDSKFDA